MAFSQPIPQEGLGYRLDAAAWKILR